MINIRRTRNIRGIVGIDGHDKRTGNKIATYIREFIGYSSRTYIEMKGDRDITSKRVQEAIWWHTGVPDQPV